MPSLQVAGNKDAAGDPASGPNRPGQVPHTALQLHAMGRIPRGNL